MLKKNSPRKIPGASWPQPSPTRYWLIFPVHLEVFLGKIILAKKKYIETTSVFGPYEYGLQKKVVWEDLQVCWTLFSYPSKISRFRTELSNPFLPGDQMRDCEIWPSLNWMKNSSPSCNLRAASLLPPKHQTKKKRYTFTKPEIEDQGVLFLHFGSFLSFENQKKLSALMRLLTKRNHPNWHAGYLKRRLFLVEHPCSMTHLDNGHWNKSLNFMFPTRYVIPKKFEGKTSSAK